MMVLSLSSADPFRGWQEGSVRCGFLEGSHSSMIKQWYSLKNGNSTETPLHVCLIDKFFTFYNVTKVILSSI